MDETTTVISHILRESIAVKLRDLARERGEHVRDDDIVEIVTSGLAEDFAADIEEGTVTLREAAAQVRQQVRGESRTYITPSRH